MRYGYEILEDRYYSDYDYEEALYERAFSEGYEYAQREFTNVSKLLRTTNQVKSAAVKSANSSGMSFKQINALKRQGNWEPIVKAANSSPKLSESLMNRGESAVRQWQQLDRVSTGKANALSKSGLSSVKNYAGQNKNFLTQSGIL